MVGHGRRARAAVAAAVGLLAVAPAAARATSPEPTLYAERVTAANAARRRVGGPDAIGGIGDWALGNGTLCAVVSDPSHESTLSARGGVLVDLAHCGRDDDQFNFLQPLFGLSRGAVLDVREVRAERTDAEARVVTRGARDGVEVETTYALSRAHPDVLRVTTRLVRTAPGEAVPIFGDILFHSNASLRPFALDTARPERSPGFAHPPLDVDDPLSLARAMVDADLHVLVGSDQLEPGVSYAYGLGAAWREPSPGEGGEREALPHFSLTGAEFTLMAVAPRPYWIGGDGVGLLALAQTLLMDALPERPLVFERWIRMGRRADVASALDPLHPEHARATGRVDDPAAVLHVHRADGAPVSILRPDPDGRFALRLGPGRYRLRAVAPGGRALERAFAVADGPGEEDLGRLAVGAPARVGLPRGAAMRLVFVGRDGTPDPPIGGDLLGLRFGTREPEGALARHVSLAGGPGDPAWLTLPPGRYRVLATRGPEFDVREAALELRAGASAALDLAAPERAIETPGWIAADLHVHSVASDDADMPLARRVASFAAAGVEVVVATEHDRVFDYAPAIRALGLAGSVASVVGAEVTSSSVSEAAPYTAGHANAFPLAYRPEAFAGGCPPGEGRRLRDLAAALRALGGTRLLQLNHPRPPGDESDLNAFFTHLSVSGEPFAPERPLAHPRNRSLLERDPGHGLRDLDFDAMELMNGPSQRRYTATRADWISLLLQGAFRAATANSDSHRAGEILGLPRSYVRVAHDDPAAFEEEDFVEAVRAGRVVGSTGPWLDARLGEAGVGERFTGRAGTLRVAVEAAPWVPVSTLRVYANGALVEARPVAPGAREEVPLRFDADAFVTVEVEGEAAGDYALLAPGATPFAFTNPIFVDADGDGRWTAPGLDGGLPEAVRPGL